MLSQFIQATATEIERERILDELCSVFMVSNPWAILCKFSYFKGIMKELGYIYNGCDYESESHLFTKDSFEISVHPVCFYEKQDLFRVCNINIMWK